jgi:hypothetical protein
MPTKNKPRPTLADYVIMALSPVLIMALVGSLVFFLLEVLYVGQYTGRMQWTLFFFVSGIVLIARISIEQGGGKAVVYGLGMAFVVWLALQSFVEYPPGSPMLAFRAAINFALIAVAWWCAHRLTWDCTYIDDSVDAAGKGVLQAAGLDERDSPFSGAPKGSADAAARSGAPLNEKHRPGLLAWWDRYCSYREEQLRQPHTPGVWVVYFSLAALPLFGLGQSLIPPGAGERRRYAFWLMVCYVASGLALLVTTSFLGLRRYLRQRKLKMPAAMAGMWMALGGGLILVMLVVGALLPRPYAEYQLIDSNFLGSKERNASRYAVLREGAAKGEGRPSSDKQSPSDDAQQSSSHPSQKKQGEAGNSKRSAGKSDQSGDAGAKQGNQQQVTKGSESPGRSDVQGSARPPSKSSERAQSREKSRQSNQKGANSDNSRDDEQQRQSGGPKLRRDEKGEDSKTGPSKGETTSAPSNPIFEVVQKLGWLGTVLKWLVFGVLAVIVVFFVLRSGLNFLANFTNWARRLLDGLRAWWEGLFSRGETEPETEMEESVPVPAPPPFASFSNPFLDGRADQLSPDALVHYSFEALEAWAWEHDVARQRDETPLEFAERLSTLVPEWETEVRGLAGFYVRLAYARGSLTAGCHDLLKRFWKRLAAAEEKSVSV